MLTRTNPWIGLLVLLVAVSVGASGVSAQENPGRDQQPEPVAPARGEPVFADKVHDELIPFAESLPSFAGSWLDGEDQNTLVIGTTDLTIEPELRKRLPAGGSLRVVPATHTQRELRAAAHLLYDEWSARNPDVKLHAVAVRADQNDLRVTVSSTDVGRAETDWLRTSAGRSVNVMVEAGEARRSAACTSRTNCFSPMKAGMYIENNASSCTGGFHVQYMHMLLAAHCEVGGNGSWSHPGYGTIGSVDGSLLGFSQDVVRIRMPPFQYSNQTYGQATTYSAGSARNPTLHEDVCVSWAASAQASCNLFWSVVDDYLIYNLPDDGLFGLVGADISKEAIRGDSGGPVYSYSWTQPIGLASGIAPGLTAIPRMGDAKYGLGEPIGNVEYVQREGGGIRVKGWAIDPDSTAGVTVNIYVDNTLYQRTANQSRSDVGVVYHAYGQYHGFNNWVAAPLGPNNVCIWVVNLLSGPSRLLGCWYVP